MEDPLAPAGEIAAALAIRGVCGHAPLAAVQDFGQWFHRHIEEGAARRTKQWQWTMLCFFFHLLVRGAGRYRGARPGRQR
eukprot:2975302-Lingulodinium_polyedra.AAC.1